MSEHKPLPNALLVHHDREWGYEIRRPEVWYERTLDVEGGQGLLFTPEPDAQDTALSIEVRDLGESVTVDDLPDLEEGFLSGLRAVPDSQIESHEAYANAFAIGIDAVQTFLEGGQRRKRWIRLLFNGTRQFRVIAQGASVEEYARLRPLFAPCMTTVMLEDRA